MGAAAAHAPPKRRLHDTAAARERRVMMQYDGETPRCASCSSYMPPVIPGDAPEDRLSWCARGNFSVNPLGCCRLWHGVNGETLAH